MALATAVAGARHTGQTITWTRANGTAHDLTGATLTGTIRNEVAGTVVAITGTLTPTSATEGIFTWAYSAADVATAGRYVVQFKATYTGTYDLSFLEPWTVDTAIVVA